MQKSPSEPTRQELVATSVTNLWIADPTAVYYLFARIRGKLKKKSLRTTTFSTAKLLVADEAKSQGTAAEQRDPKLPTELTFEQAGANPSKTLKKLKLRPSKPMLPTQKQFEQLSEHLDAVPFTQTVRATQLIRFLA